MKDLRSIDAVILCGGLGTRLKSEMGGTPKVMAPIEGQPFLDFLIRHLGDSGFKRVVLCTGYKSQFIEKYFKANPQNLTIKFSRETEPLGTGGALKNAGGVIKSDPFIVLNGDSMCPLNFQKFLEFHEAKKALASIVVSKFRDQRDFGSMGLDSTGRINAFKEKIKNKEASGGEQANVNAGVYCFNREIFKKMPPDKKFSLEKDFFPTLTKESFFGFMVEESFLDIGTPERYHAALKALKKG